MNGSHNFYNFYNKEQKKYFRQYYIFVFNEFRKVEINMKNKFSNQAMMTIFYW